MPKNGEYVKFKNYERKIKLPFVIYADFESNLVSEDNGKQNPEDSVHNIINSMIEESKCYSEVIKKKV